MSRVSEVPSAEAAFLRSRYGSGSSAVKIRLIGPDLETELLKRYLLKVLPHPIDTGGKKESDSQNTRAYLLVPTEGLAENLEGAE